MVKRAKMLLQSPFFRQNAVFFIGSLLVGGFNYIYYPILGRMMEPGAYGEVQAVIALFMQLLIFLGVISQVTVNVIANYRDEDHKQRVVFELEKVAFMFSLGLLVLGVLAAWEIKRFFNFETVWPFLTLLGVIVVTVPLTFRTAFLRAHQRFGIVSAVNAIGAAGKVALSAVLVWAGWSTFGAVAGVLAAQLLSLGYAAYKAKQVGFFRPPETRYFGRPAIKEIRPELKYAGFVLVCSTSVMLLSSIDIFVAKHYFDPQTAGEYAGVSTVAHVIFFLTVSVSQVLLPAVRIANPAKENRALLLKSLLFLIATGGLATLVLALLPRPAISLLMGGDYLVFAGLLPLLSLAMFLMSVVNLFVSYYMALRRYAVVGIIIPAICMTVVLMWASHDSVRDIVWNLMISCMTMLGLFILWRGVHLIRNWRSYVRPKTHFNNSSRL